jgi:hypothetical protein
MPDEPRALFLVEMDKDLGVGPRPKNVSWLELAPEQPMVVDLAVEDHL